VDHLLSDYAAAISALFARTTSGTKVGLERTNALLSKMGSPHKSLRAIHVAGTNGKGSVVAMVEAILRAQGFRVGRYTSPHLVDFRERITIDAVPITEQQVLSFLERWIGSGEELGATFFELTTAMAFQHFADGAVDFAVIETGLGGRLDSTNVLSPRVATVTSIGLDHTDLLGDSLRAIAIEKAGIFKPHTPAVIGETNPEIGDVLVRCAEDAGSRPIIVVDDRYATTEVEVSREGTRFTIARAGENVRLRTSLVGAHQARNAAIAIATVEAIGEQHVAGRDVLQSGLGAVSLPGRFQRVGRFVFDVAHNPAGAKTVAETITALGLPAPRSALLAVLRDKDWRGIITALAPAVDRLLITNCPSAPADRAWDPAEAHAFAIGQGIAADLEPDLDIAILRAEKRCGTVIVTGSFHTVGDVMSRLQVSPFAA